MHASVDTTGRLVLAWKPNTEPDIYGYRVYRANDAGDEYSQITVAPVQDTMFIDTINLKTLTPDIYYQLMAIDKRQNHSQFSEPLKVERPDIVPPAPPVVTGIRSTPSGVEISWIASTSPDVAKHRLLRKEKSEGSSMVIFEISISDSTRTLTDTTAQTGIAYHYNLVAIDKSGNISTPSAEMAGEKIPVSAASGLGDLRAKADRKGFLIELSWKAPEKKVTKYIIYRKTGDNGRLAVYTAITGEKPEYRDTRVKADTNFTYMVRAVLDDGSGLMSGETSVGF